LRSLHSFPHDALPILALSSVRISSVLKHPHDRERPNDEGLAKEAAAYVKGHAGIRFVTDALAALHAAPGPLRSPRDFFSWFSPRDRKSTRLNSSHRTI